jgi:hypothetical protein
MLAMKTRFDGQKILLPDELRGTPAREVVIVFEEDVVQESMPNRPSFFDLAGKAPTLRTAEDIDRQMREERDSWGDR